MDKITKWLLFRNAENNKNENIQLAERVTWMGEVINAYKISIASPSGKGPLRDLVIMFLSAAHRSCL
jgi:hypothetical protein